MMGNALESVQQITENKIVSSEAIIRDISRGKAVVMVDDEDRENEGDLVFAAEFVTPELINFMIQHCGGFICLAFEEAFAQRLELPLQPRRNLIDNQAHFTISIEARYGVETGVSAKDRAVTIQTAINEETGPDDICTPGHVFPLIAKTGGVLERTGHTEAGVDLARLAGFKGAAVICEIINKDGTMARLDDLQLFATEHNLKIGTIEDLVHYRINRSGAV